MDEIWDRIKSIKINRHKLKLALIAAEILGILALAWFLRAPLSQKFLTSPPKAYSLSQMNPQKRYLISQGDYLADKTNSKKVVILLTQNDQVLDKAKIKPDPRGEWYYQVPQSIEPGIITITVGRLDGQNKIQAIKNYRVRIISNSLLEQNKFVKSIFFPFNKKTQITSVSRDSENKIFYADFEYDTKSKKLTQLSEGSRSGELSIVLNQNLATKSGTVPYKLEVLDNNHKLIQSGWGNMNLIGKDKYTIRVETNHLKDVLINLYLANNSLLWTRVLK